MTVHAAPRARGRSLVLLAVGCAIFPRVAGATLGHPDGGAPVKPATNP